MTVLNTKATLVTVAVVGVLVCGGGVALVAGGLFLVRQRVQVDQAHIEALQAERAAALERNRAEWLASLPDEMRAVARRNVMVDEIADLFVELFYEGREEAALELTSAGFRERFDAAALDRERGRLEAAHGTYQQLHASRTSSHSELDVDGEDKTVMQLEAVHADGRVPIELVLRPGPGDSWVVDDLAFEHRDVFDDPSAEPGGPR